MYSGYWYKGVGNVVLKHFKYTEPGLALQPFIKELVLNSLDESLLELWDDAVFCPTPLFWAREKKRGFNQAQIIADVIADWCGNKRAVSLLKRTRHTNPQSETPLELRNRNVHDSFGIKREVVGLNIKSVVLVDDVVTSGSTLHACAKQLRNKLHVQNVFAYTLFKGRL